ncbi:hypothetical protein PTSG_10956 [Salpingoeca rosetta]|uniref:Uncharacterized protein n=1 Tax=Salpingoeca rosetta (strain ATCC 50818 / BSB-021) TaxID=946362 RepID=F2USA3_SALR5|nr:uncharacterized protein PTSG_10956 [Salpingoeca rosetta]EGD81012.1 hypothetical protein PTSG_10956 [Salpingoeca rosetta]|eukprot:XP_004987882.1 hypothetical protein PTSG_10956 [Salpingoeca rosetta]
MMARRGVVLAVVAAAAMMVAVVSAQNVCFTICEKCDFDVEVDRDACNHVFYQKNCVASGECVEGFNLTTIYESPRQCRFKLVTYRGGCPDSDNSNDAAPAFNSTTALINFGSKRRVCVEFPGLGYTLIEESSCRPSN